MDRLFGVDVTTTSDNNYDQSFKVAKSLGVQFVQLSMGWDEIESAPGVFQNAFLSIANIYYPAYATKVALNLSVIDTTVDRRPADLRALRFNDPAVVARFKNLLSYVFSQLPNVDLLSIALGNEVDIYLAGKTAQSLDYLDFLKQAKAYCQSVRPSVPVGAKATLYGLLAADANLSALVQASDAILTTYYPIDAQYRVKDPAVVPTELGKLASTYATKPIYLLEAGYPAGTANGSSDSKQAAFVKSTFAAWDKLPSVKALNIVWLTDLPDSAVSGYSTYYANGSLAFKSYLQTMGLRTYYGVEKASLQTLRSELTIRGW